MQEVYRITRQAAQSDASVLLLGETGTGKELVAAAIHRHSGRRDAPYLPIAPVSFNEDLIESELFGHVKGAFTGADGDRAGLFERAQGGTVLLDEIGDLPVGIQVKLLRVLEQGEYFRVGDVRPRQCDVRIIAATNRDLHRAMRDGDFREDLYYRLSGLHIHLPPLRERPEDVPVLCRHFLTLLGHDESADSLSQDLLDSLSNRPWNGNVRELRNAIDHAAVVARGRRLSIEDFPVSESVGSSAEMGHDEGLDHAVRRWASERLRREDRENVYAEFIATAEPALLDVVLKFTNDNRAAAAELLGIHRGTLREKMKQHDKQS